MSKVASGTHVSPSDASEPNLSKIIRGKETEDLFDDSVGKLQSS